MKIEIEVDDIERIAQRVAEILKPMLARAQRQDPESDIVFDVKDLAEYLRVNVSWVYKAISLKEIPYSKIGKFPRFKKRDIDRWMETKAIRPVPVLKAVKSRVAT